MRQYWYCGCMNHGEERQMIKPPEVDVCSLCGRWQPDVDTPQPVSRGEHLNSSLSRAVDKQARRLRHIAGVNHGSR